MHSPSPLPLLSPSYAFLVMLNVRYWTLSNEGRAGMWVWEHRRAMVRLASCLGLRTLWCCVVSCVSV